MSNRNPVRAVAIFLFMIGLAMAAPSIDSSWLNMVDFKPATISVFQYSFVVGAVGQLIHALGPWGE